MTTTPDFRALCAELVDELNYHADEHSVNKLIARARAALATTPPEPPADGEVSELMRCLADSLSSFKITQGDCIYPADHWSRRAAELLERAATPPPAPPTDEELLKLTEKVSTKHLCSHKSLPSDWDFGDYCSSPQGLIDFARAVLERWGK